VKGNKEERDKLFGLRREENRRIKQKETAVVLGISKERVQ
jgi:hypothetical protein